MKKFPLEREAIMPRMSGIRRNLVKLRNWGELPFEQFKRGDTFDLVQHNLRLTLEGILNIGGHILSRLPGGRPTEYAEIAVKLGELGVVDQTFAEKKLAPMAKLRNVLVHQYADIDPEKIYTVVREHLDDVETFLKAVKSVVEHPEKFGLTVK